MAAARAGLLPFTGGVRVLLASIRLRAAPVCWYSAQVARTGEKVTHTGQVFDDNDVKRARFIGRQKEVNENFAIHLVAEEPVSYVQTNVVSCDGGGGALGHPKVYINLVPSSRLQWSCLKPGAF